LTKTTSEVVNNRLLVCLHYHFSEVNLQPSLFSRDN